VTLRAAVTRTQAGEARPESGETAGTVWVLTELYFPERTSTGHFLTGIAEGLARTFDVKVICSQPTYSARGVKAPGHELRGGVEIFRCASTTLNKDRLPLRAVNALTLGAATMFRALRGVRAGDILLVVTTPPVLPLIADAVCRIRRARLVLLVHDVYPDVLVASGLAGPRSIVVRTLGAAYRRIFARAEHVIALGRDMQQVLADRVDPARIGIIPNWGDVEAVSPRPRDSNPLLRRLDIQDRFVVHYLGNMGRTHDLDLLVDAAAALRDEGVHFLFTGEGGRRSRLEAAVARAQLANVTLQPGCSMDDLPDYLNAADVAVISLNAGMAGVSVPSRLYNVLAAGKPIVAVCEPESELARVVSEHQCGWVVPPGDLPGLLRVLREAQAAVVEREHMAERARSAALRLYSPERVIRQYQSLFRWLGAPRSPGEPFRPLEETA
jgi:colanic acid biosynthesis glycosyl transferase WcaI